LLGGFLKTWEGIQEVLEFGGVETQGGIFDMITDFIEPVTKTIVFVMCVPAFMSLAVGLFTWKKANSTTMRERSYEELNTCGDLLKCCGCLSTTSQFYRIAFISGILNVMLWIVSFVLVLFIGNLAVIVYALLSAVTKAEEDDLLQSAGEQLISLKATAKNMTDENLGLALSATNSINSTISFMDSQTSYLLDMISTTFAAASSGVGNSLDGALAGSELFVDSTTSAFDMVVEMTDVCVAGSCSGPNPAAVESRDSIAAAGDVMIDGLNAATAAIDITFDSLGMISEETQVVNMATSLAMQVVGYKVGELNIKLVEFEKMLYGEGGPFETDQGFQCPGTCLNLNEYRSMIPMFKEVCLCDEDVVDIKKALTSLNDGLVVTEVGIIVMMVGLVFLLAANSSNYTYLGRRRFVERGGQFKDMIVFDSTFNPETDKAGFFDEKSEKKNTFKRANSSKVNTLTIN